MLAGLELLLGGGLLPSDLARLGASIGSDVPFFLGSAAAIVSGRGEIVDPIEARDDYSLVLAFPGEAVSTAWAYSALDAARPDDSGGIRPFAGSARRRHTRGTFGDGPSPTPSRARSAEPEARFRKAKGLILGSGASFAGMSGSGNTVFGAFEDEGAARAAVERLGEAGIHACAASPLARCEALD